MPRVKRGVTARARHKKILVQAKGYRGRRKNVYRIAKQAVMKAGQYAYRDRKVKKREFRKLWIMRINAAIRTALSPRFVPDDIFQVAEIPRTLTGKKMEVPVRKLLLGADAAKVASPDAMANPSSIDFFIQFREQVPQA